MQTNFFTELLNRLNGHNATMVISQDDGKVTVSLLPNKKGSKKELIPLNMKGTGDEFNNEFFPAFEEAMNVVVSVRNGLVTNKEEFTEAAAGEPEKKKSSRKSVKKSSGKSRPGPKPAAKKAEKKAEIKKAKGKPGPKPKAKPVIEKTPSAQAALELDEMKFTAEEEIALELAAEPVKHTDEDLAEFKGLIDLKLRDAKDEFTFIKRAKEQGSTMFTPEQAKEAFDKQEKLIANYENALERIESKDYGVTGSERGGNSLIPKEKLLSNLLTIE